MFCSFSMVMSVSYCHAMMLNCAMTDIRIRSMQGIVWLQKNYSMFFFLITFFFQCKTSWRISHIVLGFVFKYKRYPPHGSCSLLVEEGVPWQRLRAPPVSATAHELYLSESLDDLRPGDHVEVQWRRSKKFPYGMYMLFNPIAYQHSLHKDLLIYS